MKTYTMTVVIDHTYSPIRIRAYDVDVAESRHVSRAAMDVTIPDVTIPGFAPEPGHFGAAKIRWSGGEINLQVARGCWPTVAAGGCDIEWTTGPENWQGRIAGGNINGFEVRERGQMSGTK